MDEHELSARDKLKIALGITGAAGAAYLKSRGQLKTGTARFVMKTGVNSAFRTGPLGFVLLGGHGDEDTPGERERVRDLGTPPGGRGPKVYTIRAHDGSTFEISSAEFTASEASELQQLHNLARELAPVGNGLTATFPPMWFRDP